MPILRTIILLMFLPTSVHAAWKPFYGDNYLVAGNGIPGLKDGTFIDAEFRAPADIAVLPNGSALIVADRMNHCLRQVDLSHEQSVLTLCGNGTPGDYDGNSTTARLNMPNCPVITEDGTEIYFLDQNGSKIKKLSLVDGQVESIFPPIGSPAQNPPAIIGMTINENGNLIFFINKSNASLDVFDPASKKIKELAQIEDFSKYETEIYLKFQNDALYCFRPGGGELHVLRNVSQSLAADSNLPITKTPDSPVDALGPVLFGTNGLTSGEDPQTKQLMFCTWNPTAAAFKFFTGDGRLGQDFSMLDPAGQALGEIDPKPSRSPFPGEIALAVDASRRLIYVSDTRSNRIVAVHYYSQNLSEKQDLLNINGLDDPEYPQNKEAGVMRTLMVGDSLSFRNNHTEFPQKTFARQLQLYWNAFNASNGISEKEQVLLYAGHLGKLGGGPLSLILNYMELLKNYHIDRVIICISYLDLVNEATAFMRTSVPDDTASAWIDPEWAILPESEKLKEMGPLHAKLYRLLASKPDEFKGLIERSPQGRFAFKTHPQELGLLADPNFLDIALNNFKKNLSKYSLQAKAQGVETWVLLLPLSSQLNLGEADGFERNYSGDIIPFNLDGALASICSEENSGFLSLHDDLQVLGPELFPLSLYSNDHFDLRAHQWEAILLAQKLIHSIESKQ